jgi:hypothetical protein
MLGSCGMGDLNGIGREDLKMHLCRIEDDFLRLFTMTLP